jgi:hypothetical protein
VAIEHLKCGLCDWQTKIIILVNLNEFEQPFVASAYSTGLHRSSEKQRQMPKIYYSKHKTRTTQKVYESKENEHWAQCRMASWKSEIKFFNHAKNAEDSLHEENWYI